MSQERLPTVLLCWEKRDTVAPLQNETCLVDLGHWVCSDLPRVWDLGWNRHAAEELLVYGSCYLLSNQLPILNIFGLDYLHSIHTAIWLTSKCPSTLLTHLQQKREKRWLDNYWRTFFRDLEVKKFTVVMNSYS